MVSFGQATKEAFFAGLIVMIIAIVAYYAYQEYAKRYGSTPNPMYGMALAVFVVGALASYGGSYMGYCTVPMYRGM